MCLRQRWCQGTISKHGSLKINILKFSLFHVCLFSFSIQILPYIIKKSTSTYTVFHLSYYFKGILFLERNKVRQAILNNKLALFAQTMKIF